MYVRSGERKDRGVSFMEKKVWEFFEKYEINPYEEDSLTMEEKLLNIPVEEFSDDVLEFLFSNEIGVIGLAHMDFPEKWLIRFMQYDSMAAYRLAHKYYTDEECSETKFLDFVKQCANTYPDIVLNLLEFSEANRKKHLLLKVCMESDNSNIQEWAKSYTLAEQVKNLKDENEIAKIYCEGKADPIVLKAIAENSFAPLEILNILTEMKDIKGAKTIRVSAKKTIQKKNF